MSSELTEPERIERWRVLRTLARGGMATVYAAVDPESGEKVAIKLLTQPGASVPRLLQEYRSLARIDHPNIVRVFRFGTTADGNAFVVMELLDGVAAQVRVKATGRPGETARTAEAARIAHDVALALGHLHARGIVHRDLKSSNVMVLADGSTRLLDFGTARLVDAYDPITQLGEFVGTFAYASPEQLTGGAVDARSDLYSLGVLLFRMLCGRRPFEGEDPHELARSHLDASPPDPANLVPGLPRPLADLVLQLLEKLPADRPADARAVADRLAEYASEHGSRSVGHAPILGRDESFSEAQRFLGKATPGSILFVTGDAGAGRRTFVELVAEEAARRGARIVPLVGDDDAFRRLVWAVRDLRPEDEPEPLDSDPSTASPLPETVALVARLLALRARAENRVTVLAAPAYWAVPAAARDAILRVMAETAGHGAPVVLVAAEGSRPRSSRQDAGITQVRLRPLSGAEVATIAAHWLGVSGIPPELARRLLRASGGQPGPLTEIVRALPGAQPHAPILIPPALRDEAMSQLEAMHPEERRALEALALAEFDIVRVAWLVDRDHSTTTDVLAGLVRRGILEDQGGFFRIRDGLLGELVRGETHPVRGHLLCRRLAAIAEDLPPAEAVAEACRVAGRVKEAAEVAVRWAWPLVRAGVWGEAFPLLDRIGAENPQLDAAVGVRFWTLYAECMAELQLQPAAATEAIGRAAALVQDSSDAAEVELAASRLARARSDAGAERALLQTALARFEEAPTDARVAEGRAHLADLLVRSGELPAALSEAGRALRAGVHDLVRYATTLGYTQLASGRLADAELSFRAAEARALAEQKTAWRAVAGLVVVFGTQGRFSEALHLGDSAERSGRAGAPAQRLAALQLALTEVDLALNRHGTARKRLDQALDALHGEIPPRLEARFALLRARLAWDAGEPDRAIETVEAALQSEGVEAARGGAAEVRGLRGIFLSGRGQADIGWIDLAAATTALVEMGALPALSRLAELATAAIDDPALVEPLWAPVAGWIVEQEARPARLARAVNRLRFVRARGWDDSAERLELGARWNDLVGQLSAPDSSALRVHPWARLAGAR